MDLNILLENLKDSLDGNEIWSGFYQRRYSTKFGVFRYDKDKCINTFTSIPVSKRENYYELQNELHNTYQLKIEDESVYKAGELLLYINEEITSIKFSWECGVLNTYDYTWIIAHLTDKSRWEIGNWCVVKESINNPQDITLYNFDKKELEELRLTKEYKNLIHAVIRVSAYDRRRWWF